MSPHELRDYYKQMSQKAALQMVTQPEGLNKQSAEETYKYFKDLYNHYNALCNKAKL